MGDFSQNLENDSFEYGIFFFQYFAIDIQFLFCIKTSINVAFWIRHSFHFAICFNLKVNFVESAYDLDFFFIYYCECDELCLIICALFSFFFSAILEQQ